VDGLDYKTPVGFSSDKASEVLDTSQHPKWNSTPLPSDAHVEHRHCHVIYRSGRKNERIERAFRAWNLLLGVSSWNWFLG